ncbi:hypothetical protein L7F22_035591 [Adiantum nelumboides]|nr:hypothetical protein [Adiantum nelumboides]
MTKTERKSEYNKLKKTLKDVWTTEMETDEDANSDKMDVPSHYKKYTIQDRKIIVQQPMKELKEPGTSYDGPKKAKKIDLDEPVKEPKPAYIATDLTEEEEQLLIATLKQYRDVFAWSYKDLERVDPSICQHTIPLNSDAKPSRQRPYTYNETFVRKIKEEIDKLKEAEFIYEIEHMDWVSPIVVVPKKNGKLRVCVNLKKRNDQRKFERTAEQAGLELREELPKQQKVLEVQSEEDEEEDLQEIQMDPTPQAPKFPQVPSQQAHPSPPPAPPQATNTEEFSKEPTSHETWSCNNKLLIQPMSHYTCPLERQLKLKDNPSHQGKWMPCQKTARQWDKSPYEVDELSTNEKSHIPDEVLAQIPAHIFIAKFRDEEAALSRSTRSRKSSNDDERTDTDKDQDSRESDREDIPKEAEAADPLEYERSDEEDTSTPLEKKSQKPRSREQVLMDEAMARVKARRKELVDARAAKAAKTAKPATMEEARKLRMEKSKALQKERKRLEAEEKAQEEAEAAQAA